MLTGYQCETIAYIVADAGEIICRGCAEDTYSTLCLDKLDRGLSCGASGVLDPLIRYSVDEISGERASEYASEEHDYETDPEGWQAAYDAVDFYPCDQCGCEIR